MNTKLLFLCIFSLLFQPLSAQTFSVEYGSNDYTKTVGGVGYRLSIPTLHGAQPAAIRAVVVANPGVGGSTAFKVNERWVRWLHDNGLAYIGNDSPYSSGSLNALAAFAGDNLGGTTYPELQNVPVLVFGHSAGGSSTTADAWNHPERCIAFVVEHTRIFLDVHDFANPAAAKAVPGYFRWGEWDHVRFWEGYQTGMGGDEVSTEVPTSAKVSIHAMIAQGAQWMTAYEHRQEHATQRHAIEEAMGFFGLMLPLRYDYQEGVSGKDPKLGPVNLMPINREDGWMGEHNFGAIQTRVVLNEFDEIDPAATHYSNFLMDWESAGPHVAPFAEFERQNKDEGHSWMADGDVAAFWATKFSHGHFDLQVDFLDLISDDLGTSAVVNRNSLFPNAVNTDQAVRVRVRPDGFPEAERVEFFRGATLVGTVTDAPYDFTYTFAPGDEGMHALYPVAVSAAGERRVGPRRMVQVVSNIRGSNTAPTVSPIGFVEGQAGQTLSVPFTLGDVDGDSLTVVWREVNRAGVASGSYTATIGGSGANRTLDLTLPPTPGIIWGLVRVYDGDISTYTAVTIHVGGDGTAEPFFVGAEAIGLGGRGVGQNAIGAWSRKFSVRVYDYETDPRDLILTATSSNQTNIPNENIRVGGAGQFRYVQVKPLGFATITLELSDGNTSVTESFSLTTRTADNTPPVISAIPDQTAFSGTLSDPVEVRVYDLHDETSDMTFTVVSSDPTLIPNESLQISQVSERQHIRFTPSQGLTGTATLTATVTDTGGLSATSSFTVTVADPPDVQISDAPLPAGMLTQFYTHTLQASGGLPPYTWTLHSGSLPAGLSLNSSGLLSGTPSEAGSFTFTVQVIDQEGDTETAEVSLIIHGAPVITAHPQSVMVLPGGNAAFSVTAVGESVSYQWYESGTLIEGATAETLILENVLTERTVFARVSNPAGSVDSDAATVSLSEVAPSMKVNLGADLGAGWNSYADFSVFDGENSITLNNLVFEDGAPADGVSLTLTRSTTNASFCLAISDQTATAPASDWLMEAAAQSFWFINLNNGNPPHHLTFSIEGLPDGTYDLEAYVYVNSSYGSPANGYKFDRAATLAGLDGVLEPTDTPIASADYNATTTGSVILRWTDLQVTGGQSLDLRAAPGINSKMPVLNAFSIRGKALASAGPEITVHPASLTIQENESTTLSVTATSSGGDLSYQWYEGPSGDTSAPVGGGQNVFTTPALTRTTGYWVRVSDDNSFTDSATAVVTVQRSGAPERILFIGNSFTNGYAAPMLTYNNSEVNDLNGGTHGGIPGIFAKLAAQGGYPVEVGIESVNGSTLYSRFPGKMDLITDPAWDRYVLQGRSQEAIPNARGGMADGFPATVGNVAGAIRSANANAGIHLYAFWASPKYLGAEINPATEHYYTNEEGLRTFQDEINSIYHQVNQQHGLDGWVAVGEAFQSALAQGLTPMWIHDDHHASATGAYLSALMFYRDLLGGDPRLLDIGPGSAAVELGLTAFQANTAHEIAFAQSQPEPEPPVIIEQVRIPMRDGAFLDAEIYRFGDSNFTPYPVTVISTIYNLDFHRHRYVDGTTDYGILADGQIYVGVHMRDAASGLEPFELGSYASAYQATEDAYDIIEWISRQPWCNGRVGFKGGSGNGVGGSAAIWSNHPNLTAVNVVHTSSNFHDYWLYENGVKRDTFSLIGNRGINTHARLSIKPDTVRTEKTEWMEWTRQRALDFQGVYIESTGLYDIFQQAALDNFTALTDTGRAHVILEPRWHGPAVQKYDGSGDSYSIYAGRPGFSVNYNDLMNGAAPAGTSQFHYAVISPSTNVYRSSDRFPLPHTPVPFYLRADGGLAHTPPAGAEEGTVTYSYDPNNPAPNVGGKAFSSGTNYGPLDQSGISGRSDIVVFESPVFTEAMEFTGDIEVDLYFSTDVEDTQFVVKLVDVNPDTGFEALLRKGVCMARYQAGFGEDPATLPRLQPGVVYHLNFNLWAASHILEPGHKLAVHITSAAADITETDARRHYYEIHPNSFDPVASLDGEPVANQVIHATAAHPSRVVLPVTQWQGPGPQLRVTRDGLELTLENRHLTHDLDLSGITLEGEHAADFSVPSFPATLPAGTSETLPLGFNAAGPGLRQATIVIESNDPFVPETRVDVEAGRGLLIRGGEWIAAGDSEPSWQKHSDFLDLRRGRSRDRVFTLHNFSNSPVTISNVDISGHNAFSMMQAPAAPLPAGESTTLVLRYAPTTGGVHTATVTVESNDADTPAYSFALRGGCTAYGPIHDLLQAPENRIVNADAQTIWSLDTAALFHSPDGQAMDILVTLADGSPLPAWLAWNNGTFTANPSAANAGTYTIRVRAQETNTPSLFEDVSFILEVTSTSDPVNPGAEAWVAFHNTEENASNPLADTLITKGNAEGTVYTLRNAADGSDADGATLTITRTGTWQSNSNAAAVMPVVGELDELFGGNIHIDARFNWAQNTSTALLTFNNLPAGTYDLALGHNRGNTGNLTRVTLQNVSSPSYHILDSNNTNVGQVARWTDIQPTGNGGTSFSVLVEKVSGSFHYLPQLIRLAYTPPEPPEPEGYDAWIAGHGLTGTDADDLADPDNDGIVNLLEYAFALNPNEPNTTREGLPYGGALEENGDLYHTISFRRNLQAQDILYHIDESEDLETWSTLQDPDILFLSQDPEDDSAEWVQVRINVSEKTRHFLRVRVQKILSF
jgi:predicted acyl esterase/pimeloyl-ACP methyl ester carboxylesterase